MAGRGRRKPRRKPAAKTRKPKLRDWRMTPEHQHRAKRYGAFLEKHYPIDTEEHMKESFEKLIEGLEL